METNQALNIVKEQLTEHRYQHTIGVMETAITLAERFGADKEKARIASIFHDYAKFRSKQEMKAIVEKEKLPSELLEYGDELLHAPVGAYLVNKEVGVKDEEVLNAIRYHTTGRVGMTSLEKVIYLADYIEPGRHFPGVEEVRKTAETDLELAIVQSLANTMTFLIKKKQKVFPETLATYNDLIEKIKREDV